MDKVSSLVGGFFSGAKKDCGPSFGSRNAAECTPLFVDRPGFFPGDHSAAKLFSQIPTTEDRACSMKQIIATGRWSTEPSLKQWALSTKNRPSRKGNEVYIGLATYVESKCHGSKTNGHHGSAWDLRSLREDGGTPF